MYLCTVHTATSYLVRYRTPDLLILQRKSPYLAYNMSSLADLERGGHSRRAYAKRTAVLSAGSTVCLRVGMYWALAWFKLWQPVGKVHPLGAEANDPGQWVWCMSQPRPTSPILTLKRATALHVWWLKSNSGAGRAVGKLAILRFAMWLYSSRITHTARLCWWWRYIPVWGSMSRHAEREGIRNLFFFFL